MPAVCAVLVCAVGLAADGTEARLASVDTVFLPLFCAAGCAGFRFCALSAVTACPASVRGIAETPIFCGTVLSPVRPFLSEGGRETVCLRMGALPSTDVWTFVCTGPAAVSAANSAELRTTAAPPPDTGPGLAGDVGEVPAPPERLKPDCPLLVPAAADFPMFCAMFLATM